MVERSSDASSGHTAGIITGKGNSVSCNSYSFTDTKPYIGKSYYRIHQVDADNRYTLTDVYTVHENCTPTKAITLYPNPATDRFQVVLPVGYTAKSIVLYNAMGQQLQTPVTTNDNVRIVNVSSVPAGSYLLKITGADNGVFTRAITVIK